MKWLKDVHDRQIRLTNERLEHIEGDHPEMFGQFDKIGQTLQNPDIIIKSRTYLYVELFYKHYDVTPVNEKYLCIVVKTMDDEDIFIITAYFTDTIKKGEVLWQKK